MSDFINTIDVLGDDTLSDSIIERTIEEFADNTIIKLGHSAFRSCENLVSIDLPSLISVNNCVFDNCVNLTRANLPNVTSISRSMFWGCANLTNINMPNVTSIGNYAFTNCNSLTSVNFPMVTSIGVDAFYDCNSLTSVNFPNVTSINVNAFYNCTLLQDVNMPNVTSVSNNAFNNCTLLQEVNIPNVTSIGVDAFYDCNSLTSVNFPMITSVGNDVFRHCRSLTSVNLPNVTSIGNSAFYGCSNLTSINMPNVTSIQDYAFFSCRSLISVNLPSATSIGSYVFRNCRSLTSVNLPNVTSIGNHAFNAFDMVSKLKNVNMPNVININNSAFLNCISLTSINLPSAKNINNAAFSQCYNLTSVNLPNVTSIGNYAFNCCVNLTTVDTSSKVNIFSSAFVTCYNLTALILRSNELCTLKATNAFTSTPIGNKNNGYIYTPASIINNYKNATNWSTYSNQFRAIEDYTIDGTTTGLLALEIQDDWTTIMNAVNNGSYKYKYSVGSYKPLDLGDEGIVNMQIVAMDTDELSDGTGTAAVTWVARDLLATKHRMNPALASTTDDAGNTVYTEGTGAIGGWEKSEMRSYLKETIKPLISSDILETIVEVKKTQTAYDTAGSVFTQETADDVWIPDYYEVYESNCTYKLCYPDNTSRIKKLQAGSANNWWIRHAANGTKIFSCIGDSGSHDGNGHASNPYGIALSFCTGKTK